MPTNLIKVYADLLELAFLNEQKRTESLRGVFNKDIKENPSFKFRGKKIYPLKGEEPNIEILFTHLTCEEIWVEEENGLKYKKRVFDMDRSVRLHWIRHHVEECKCKDVKVFSVTERDTKKRIDVTKTYIYNREQEYIIVLEPQRDGNSYYLLTAYYLNKEWGRRDIRRKYKHRLGEVY